MPQDDLGKELARRGYRVGEVVIREDGMMLYQLNGIFMFRADVEDLAEGRTTIADILARNKGKVFPNAPLKLYRSLSISGSLGQLGAFLDEVEKNLGHGWTRDRDDEERAKRRTTTQMFCFKCSALGGRKSCNLWLAYQGASELYIANIVPLNEKSLTNEEYNNILLEFFHSFALPAAERTGVLLNLTEEEADLEYWITSETARLLRTFSEKANKSTGATHPFDRARWHRFLIAAHKENRRLGSDMLRNWLQSTGGWSEDAAFELSVEYERALALLESYDSLKQANA